MPIYGSALKQTFESIFLVSLNKKFEIPLMLVNSRN
jgi:hypothetical protein